MNVLCRLSVTALACAALTSPSLADGRNPGSVLIYPIHRSSLGAGSAFFTVVSVTNTNLNPVGGSTNVEFQYVNTVKNPQNTFDPFGCFISDIVEVLTPADTLSVLTSCHNAAAGQEGYLVVSAQDPAKFKTEWSFNHLSGSELVINSDGSLYSLNAIPFLSPLAQGQETDVDGDEELDFDGVEYEGIPNELYLEFLALTRSSLILINLTGGTDFRATVKFDAFNDIEVPLSATRTFRCWFEARLSSLSLIFSKEFLATVQPNDPSELDTDCDGEDDVDAGWSRIRGVVANSSQATIVDPAILGAVTAGESRMFDGGHLLWESEARQFNGDFLHFGGTPPN